MYGFAIGVTCRLAYAIRKRNGCKFSAKVTAKSPTYNMIYVQPWRVVVVAVEAVMKEI